MIFGAAFTDSKSGYAWGDDDVYRTETGGLSWTHQRMDNLVAEGSPWPAIGSNGELWIIQRPSRDGPRSELLVRLSRELKIDGRLEIRDQVERLDGTDRGVRLFGRKDFYGSAQLVEVMLEGGNLNYRLISDLGADLPIDYAAEGDSMAAILSDTSNLGSRRYLLLSSDGGRIWSRSDFASESPMVLCINAHRTWIAGQKGVWHVP